MNTVHPTLIDAVRTLTPNDARRIYAVTRGKDTVYAVAQSPGQACLAAVGEDNVSLVSREEKFQAALEALMEKGDHAQ